MGRNSEFKKPRADEDKPPLYIYIGSTPYILASEAAKRMERIIEIERRK